MTSLTSPPTKPWRRRRTGTVVVLLTLFAWWRSWVFQPEWTEAVRYGPITLDVRSENGHAGWIWSLHVDSNRQATLTVSQYSVEHSLAFEVREQEWRQLRQLPADDSFLELDTVYGQLVSDSSSDVVTVTAGDYTHSVKLLFLMNWVRDNRQELIEPARAVRILRLAQNWCDDPLVTSQSRYDQIVLDAVPRTCWDRIHVVMHSWFH